MKKRILIDARMFGLEFTGIGRYVMHLVEGLAKEGSPYDFTILLNRKYYGLLNLPSNWKKVEVNIPYYSLQEQLELPKIITKIQPDLVHFPHLNIPIFWRGKFIVTIHDITMHKQGTDATTLPLPLYLLKRIPYKVIFRKAIVNSSKIIVPSNSVKNELERYFKLSGEKINTVYEGLTDNYLVQPDESVLYKYNIRKPYFIYTGNLYPHKNLKRVVEALNQLNKSEKVKKNLVIVCRRDVFLSRFRNVIKANSAENYVRFFGFIPDKDLVSLYKYSIGFVYASLNEGFGLQGLEAMAAGAILLASDIPVFKEIYKDNVQYFNPYDFSAIAKTMKQTILMKASRRKSMIKKARKFVTRYSWQRMTIETLKVYESSLSD